MYLCITLTLDSISFFSFTFLEQWFLLILSYSPVTWDFIFSTFYNFIKLEQNNSSTEILNRNNYFNLYAFVI